MNKIDEIKRRVELNTGNGLQEDARYLLSTLEQAENALGAIANYKAGNSPMHVQTLKETACEALKQLGRDNIE